MVSKLLALEAVITCVWYSGTKLPCLLPKKNKKKNGYTLTNPLSSNNIAGN